ncbi:3'-5' RNA exonuclease complex component [Paecilomyces lecythidis]
MLLGLNVLEHRSHAGPGDLKAVASTYSVFNELLETGVSRPAKLAVSRLGELLNKISHKQRIMDQKLMSSHGMILVEDPEIRGTIGNEYTPFAWSEAPIRSNAEEPVPQRGQPENITRIGALEHATMSDSPGPREQNWHGNHTPIVHSPELNSERTSSTNSPNCALTPETPTYLGPEDTRTTTYAAPMHTFVTCPPLAPQMATQQLPLHSALAHEQHHLYTSPGVYSHGYTDWGSTYPGMSTDMSSYYAYTSIS